jgi:hypothetical protein
MNFFSNRDAPINPRPHKDASLCRCSCHSGIGRSVHFTACCIGGWVLPASYREPAQERECGNPDCCWKGTTDRMVGKVGPLCPECGEVTELVKTVRARPGAVVLR